MDYFRSMARNSIKTESQTPSLCSSEGDHDYGIKSAAAKTESDQESPTESDSPKDTATSPQPDGTTQQKVSVSRRKLIQVQRVPTRRHPDDVWPQRVDLGSICAVEKPAKKPKLAVRGRGRPKGSYKIVGKLNNEKPKLTVYEDSEDNTEIRLEIPVETDQIFFDISPRISKRLKEKKEKTVCSKGKTETMTETLAENATGVILIAPIDAPSAGDQDVSATSPGQSSTKTSTITSKPTPIKPKGVVFKEFLLSLQSEEYERDEQYKGKKIYTFKCLSCEFITKAMREYQQHKAWHTRQSEEAKLEPEDYSDEESASGSVVRIFKCRLCDYRSVIETD